MSSSDETIFGDAFFEPIAKICSGGMVSPSEGVDVAIETDTTYKAIAVKSGPKKLNTEGGCNKIYSRHDGKTVYSSFQGQIGAGTLEGREDLCLNSH